MSDEYEEVDHFAETPLDKFIMTGFDFGTASRYTASVTWFNRYETEQFWRLHALREYIEDLYKDLRMERSLCTAQFRLSPKAGWQEVYVFPDNEGLRVTVMSSLSFPSALQWRLGVTQFKEDMNPLLNKLYDVRKKARLLGYLREDQVLRAVIKFLLNIPKHAMIMTIPDPDGHSLIINIGWKSPDMKDNPDMINLMIQDSRRILF